MPISGKVTEINDELNDFPEKVNTDPYSDGWMIRILPKSDVNLETLLNLLNIHQKSVILKPS